MADLLATARGGQGAARGRGGAGGRPTAAAATYRPGDEFVMLPTSRDIYPDDPNLVPEQDVRIEGPA